MTSLYTKFVSSVAFPLHERLKHHTSVELRRHLEITQWYSAGQIEEIRVEKLKNFFTVIARDVPYYSDVFSEYSIKPHKIDSIDVLKKIPFLTKKIIKKNTDRLKSRASKKLIRYNTGGSSGEPLVFYMGLGRVSHDVAAKWRATRWWGVDIGDPEIVVWGSPIELGAQDRLRSVRDKIFRSTLLPAFEMSESNLDEFVKSIIEIRPAMLFGYPSSIALIAQHAERRNVSLTELGVRVVFVTSERLYDHQRESIERAFSCPVANGYGGRDAGFIAHECPSGGMHITAEDIIVEIVDQEGKVLAPGQSGEVVITNMSTTDFPFVRYKTGDVAILDTKTCACGRGLPLLKEIQGRTTDFIIASDGTIMHGLALIYVLRDLPGVELFKIIQEQRNFLRILLVPSDLYTQETDAVIVTSLQKRLGQSTKIEIEKVREIPREKNGKYRYVQSNITPP